MSTQLLIYENAVPVSAQQHRDWSVKTGTDYGFARQMNSVPLMAVELPAAAQEYAIVFAGDDKAVMPVAILAMRNGENLYVKAEGGWDAKYLPAFIRRYPFVFSSSDDGSNFTLCIDESFSGFNQEGRGERLFDADGERTSYLNSVLEFLKGYQAEFQRTQALGRKLLELELLEPMRAQVTLNNGEQMGVEGFMAVSRDRLKALDGEQLADLMKTDTLELLYLHLHSLNNLNQMVERVAASTAPAEAAPTKKSAARGGRKRKADEDKGGKDELH